MGAPERQVKRRKLDSAPVPQREPSQLESLPVEILEQIFLKSSNPALLRVSESLRLSLSSDYARKAILLQTFRVQGIHDEDEPLWTELQPSSKKEKSASVKVEYDYFEQRLPARCPSAVRDLHYLLDEEWVTMSLLKSVITDWMMEVSCLELRQFLKDFDYPESTINEASLGLRETIENAMAHMIRTGIGKQRGLEVWQSDDALAPLDRSPARIAKCAWTHSWPSAEDKSHGISISFSEDGAEGRTPLGYVCVTVWTRSSSGTWRPVRTSERHFVTWRGDYRILAPRLLQGPWTQDRGDLLKFLLDACEGIDCFVEQALSPKQEAAASLGVLQALREDNQMALSVLLGRCSPACSWICNHYLLDHRFASDNLPPSQPKKPDGAWQRLSWSQEVMPSIGAELTTAHLQECVDNIDSHMAASIQVLGHLSHPATKVPMLPPAFMAKLQARVEGNWEGDDCHMGRMHDALRKLYEDFVSKGLGSFGVALTGFKSARTAGANVSLYASRAKLYNSLSP